MTTVSQLSSALADRYRIEREIGAGGMATVFLATDLKHDRAVAIKVLKPELAAVLGTERFLQEVRIAARLDHPHILTLIDSGAADGMLYYVLPFVRGESLRAKLARERQLPIDDALSIARQVGGALEYAHRQGVVHRDIKPENILLHEGEAILTDFGIALAVREAGGNRLTETGTSLGTPEYMSPEQATGDRTLDARSDVYSLGAVVYEMLTGEPPHTGASVQAVIAKLLTERPTRVQVLRETVPASVDAAVSKALAKVPADRYRSAGDFVAALGDGTAAAAPAARARLPQWMLGAGAVLAAVAIGYAVWLRRPTAGPTVTYDRVQLTTSGGASHPIISPDGAQVAYSASSCTDDGTCRVSIMLRDLASNVERPIVDGLDWGGPERWSANGSWLLFNGHPLGKPDGTYVVSRLGGPLTYVGLGDGDFTPSGDTVLVAPGVSARRIVHLQVIPVSTAQAVDSVAITAPRGATALDYVRVAPNGRWIAVLWSNYPTYASVFIYDRAGRIVDSTRVPTNTNASLEWNPASTALYEAVRPASGRGGLLRTAVDAVSGKIARQDTVVLALGDEGLSQFDVSANGKLLAYAAARTGLFVLWTLEQQVAGQPPRPVRRVRSASTSFGFYLSKDGRNIYYAAPASGASSQGQLFVEPFEGGEARAVTPPISGLGYWNPTLDGKRIIVETPSAGGGSHLTAYDVLTQRATPFADVPASGNIRESGPDGIVMVDEGRDTLRIFDGSGHERHRVGLPDSVGRAVELVSSPDASQFMLIAYALGTESTEHGEQPVGVYVVSAATGTLRLARRDTITRGLPPTQWASDGWIYSGIVFGSQRPMLYRTKLEAGSRTEPVSGLPFAPDFCLCYMASDPHRWIGATSQSTSDIYLIRNFDAAHP